MWSVLHFTWQITNLARLTPQKVGKHEHSCCPVTLNTSSSTMQIEYPSTCKVVGSAALNTALWQYCLNASGTSISETRVIETSPMFHPLCTLGTLWLLLAGY